jgi:hypothetical protein
MPILALGLASTLAEWLLAELWLAIRLLLESLSLGLETLALTLKSLVIKSSLPLEAALSLSLPTHFN